LLEYYIEYRGENGDIMRKLIICLLLVLITCSCAGTKTPKDKLVVGIKTSPNSFDPRIAAGAMSQHINRLIFNGLVKFDDNFNFVPDLAEEFEQVNDTTYKFVIRPDVYFHNGDKLTVEDVIYTFSSILGDEIASPFKTTFSYIKDMKKQGDRTLIIKLKEPNAPFITAMRKGIVSKKAASELGKDYAHNPIGTGPYEFVEFKADSFLTLKRNEKYFSEKPKLSNLEFRILKDENVRVLQMMKGSIDLIQNAVTPVLLNTLKKKKNLVVDAKPSIVFDYMGMNLTDKILSDLLVRKALAYAINREDVIKYKLEGYGEIADTLLMPSHWAFSKDVTKYNYNPEKAKRILDEAGYKDPDGDGPLPRFKLSYKTSIQKLRIEIAQLIAEQLRKVGIDVKVTPYEWGTFFRDIKTANFQLYTLAWVGVTEPDLYYSIYHSKEIPPNGANRNRYVNKEIDRLVELGRSTLNLKKRKSIYAKIQKIVSDELPYIPLWYEDTIIVRQKNVKGYKITPNAGYEGVIFVTKE